MTYNRQLRTEIMLTVSHVPNSFLQQYNKLKFLALVVRKGWDAGGDQINY